ncbi:MAG: sodium ion-translocating decarboxylase subunit beta [Thermodesulfobacteriota bacterium]|nr:sodium ion-translocating decarboxylase subunit beta [Thermodesulfobacteriota bacterium]
MNIWDFFPGLSSFALMETGQILIRIFLILLGFFLVYLGFKEKLDPLLMVPMGFMMAVVNAGILIMTKGELGTLFIDPLVSEPAKLLEALQIYFLQPIYTFTFANGLIACLVFLGIGSITDLDFFIARPFLSLFLAVFAELGTILTFPLAVALGFDFKEAAAIAIVGGADGPMVLFTSLILAKHLFVPISVVAYVYLGICYAVFPYLAKLLIPKRLRAIAMDPMEIRPVTSTEKFFFAVVAGVTLCLLFPVAAPLFTCFFLGVAVKEANIGRFREFLDILLSGSTLFLGITLGALLSVTTVMDPKVLLIMILGMVALLLSGIGGIIGGLIVCKWSGGKINPLIGIAAVSCVPTTAKVAQKCAMEEDETIMILPHAMGPCVAGVITTAIICAIYVTIMQLK